MIVTKRRAIKLSYLTDIVEGSSGRSGYVMHRRYSYHSLSIKSKVPSMSLDKPRFVFVRVLGLRVFGLRVLGLRRADEA